MAEYEVNISSGAMLGPGTIPLLTLPMEITVIMAKLMGYRGVEWRPSRSVADVQITTNKLSPYAKSGIRSAEQSYRAEKTWREASTHPNKRLAQASFLLFPHRIGSLRNLIRLQQIVGEIPVTVYPTDDEEELGLQASLTNKLIQPSPEVVKLWNTGSFNDLILGIHERELGINLDLFHFQRLKASGILKDFPNLNQSLESIFPFIREVQFSANRCDFETGPEIDTRQAYLDLLSGTDKAEVTKMLEMLIDMGYRGPVVTEIPAPTISNNPVALVAHHRQISRRLALLNSLLK